MRMHILSLNELLPSSSLIEIKKKSLTEAAATHAEYTRDKKFAESVHNKFKIAQQSIFQ